MDNKNEVSDVNAKPSCVSIWLCISLLLLAFATLGFGYLKVPFGQINDNTKQLAQLSQSIKQMSTDIQDIVKMQKKLNAEFAKLNIKREYLGLPDKTEDINTVIRRYQPNSSFIYSPMVYQSSQKEQKQITF